MRFNNNNNSNNINNKNDDDDDDDDDKITGYRANQERKNEVKINGFVETVRIRADLKQPRSNVIFSTGIFLKSMIVLGHMLYCETP